VTPFANRRGVANLAYWVTGTEGSNPSLSAKSVFAIEDGVKPLSTPSVTRVGSEWGDQQRSIP
jgi:hypothetical protein